ncbi:MAG: putative NEK protein kinase, partial [Streblomastix strix]
GYGGGIFITGDGNYDPSTKRLDLSGMQILDNSAEKSGQSLYVVMNKLKDWCQYGLSGEYVKGNYSDTLSNTNETEGIAKDQSSFNTLYPQEIQAQQNHLQYLWTTQIASLISVGVALNVSNTDAPLQFSIKGRGMIQEKLCVKLIEIGSKTSINLILVLKKANAIEVVYPPDDGSGAPITVTGDPQGEQTATFGMKDYQWYDSQKKYNILLSNDRKIFTGVEGKEDSGISLDVQELVGEEPKEEEEQKEIDSPGGFKLTMWMYILIGGVAFLIIVIVIIFICCICRHKRQKDRKQENIQMNTYNQTYKQEPYVPQSSPYSYNSPSSSNYVNQNQSQLQNQGNFSARMNQSSVYPQSLSQAGPEVDIVAQILNSQQNSARKERNPVMPAPAPIDPNAPFNTTWDKTDFEKVKKLGRGGFGTVWCMMERSTQRVVAIKVVDYDNEQAQQMILKERDIMLNIYESIKKSSPPGSFIHVVQPLGFFLSEDSTKAYLVLEFCSRGDMRKYITNMRESGTEISNKRAFELIAQIISAVDQLHANGIIHGDLKPENVLVMKDYRVKLSDFGLARKIEEGRDYLTAMGGTTFYLGPELLQNQVEQSQGAQKLMQTPAADIWAIGVMIFELLAQRHPFFDAKDGNLPLLELARRITVEKPAELPSHYSENLRKLIRNMLTKDPSRRITSADILEIPEVAECLTRQ